MTSTKRKWDLISEKKRTELIKGLVNFFKTHRDEEIGVIAAGDILDHFLQDVGIELYNKGVEDSISYLKGRFESIGWDMESILKK